MEVANEKVKDSSLRDCGEGKSYRYSMIECFCSEADLEAIGADRGSYDHQDFRPVCYGTHS